MRDRSVEQFEKELKTVLTIRKVCDERLSREAVSLTARLKSAEHALRQDQCALETLGHPTEASLHFARS